MKGSMGCGSTRREDEEKGGRRENGGRTRRRGEGERKQWGGRRAHKTFHLRDIKTRVNFY